MPVKPYADIHSHIIPNVDDGSRDMDMTREMLSIAYEEGIRTMYATPHFGSGKERYDRDYLMEQYEKVREEAKNAGEEGIEVYLGNEIFYRSDTIEQLKSGNALTINKTKYVLVEFPVEIRYNDLYAALQKLVMAGYRPILAHLERYFCLYKKFDYLYAIKKLGVALQINTDSVLSRFDSNAIFCRKLIRERYVDFLGSDAHTVSWRPPCMESAVAVISKKTEDLVMDKLLVVNHNRLLEGKYL